MKFYLKFPDGGEIKFEKEPMGKDRFVWICSLLLTYMVGSGVLKFFSMMTGG